MGARGGPETLQRELAETIERHLPPLQARVRRRTVAELARRAAALEGEPLPEYPPARRLAVLVARVEQVSDAYADEERRISARLAKFAEDWAQATTPAARRALLRTWIDTHESARDRRGSREALDRFFSDDVVREREELTRTRLQVARELACAFVARAGASLVREGVTSEVARHAAFLRRNWESATRWQLRLACAEGLLELTRALSEAEVANGLALDDVHWILSRGSVPEPSPWVQAATIELACTLSPDLAHALVRRRVLDRGESADDFLVRRRLLRFAARGWRPEPFVELARRVIDAADPSEHVRTGLCEDLVDAGIDAALEQLARLAATDAEASPRVRASALLALGRALDSQDPVRSDALVATAGVLATSLESDGDALVQRTALDVLEALTPRVDLSAADASIVEAFGRLESALVTLRNDAAVAERVRERCAEVLEVLARERSPVRRAWTRHLAEQARTIAPGTARTLPLVPTDTVVPAMPPGPDFLGRVLADLTRRDHGLYVSPTGDGARLWRGDRLVRRLWRVLHELRHPLPNKRQAFRHTTGRGVPATLRAHSAILHEVTATAVPGERVELGLNAGWGRHLPTVDDVLDLPLLKGEPLRLYSSHGVTIVEPPPKFADRVRARLRASTHYAELASQRLASLRADETRDRRRYVERLEELLGVRVSFAPFEAGGGAVVLPSPSVAALFPDRAPDARGIPTAVGGLAIGATTGFQEFVDSVSMHGSYFVSPVENGPRALAFFTAAVLTAFLVEARAKRASIGPARERLPLCIGGWGTRGKSGTERLKAALFHGLGFEVFSKTTGSEAMFIHSVPSMSPAELFIFRPYDKATIWEQRDMLLLADRLGVEVFLWECMALNPQFVELLEHDWMRDDVATLTNAYPDHEDIQGPAGIDVARVISRFVPSGSTVVTSEDNFLPLFDDAARARGTKLLHVPERDAELMPDDLLARFPYQEHPRNIALVTRLAEHLGIERDFAIALMADHVVPELGNLKVFPEVRVRGRRLTFINGHSANERTGFLNNWRRLRLHEVDLAAEPDRVVVTVVNNRWDRVARSEVFARILVEDADADRHVLIGTNLNGLVTYVEDALDRFLGGVEPATADDLASELSRARASGRLTKLFAKLRVPDPKVDPVMARLTTWAAAANRALPADRESTLREAISALLASEGPTDPGAIRSELESGGWSDRLTSAFQAATPTTIDGPAEVLEAAPPEDLTLFALDLLTKVTTFARLRRGLASVDAAGLGAWNESVRRAYRAIFLAKVDVVADAGATGDQIIDRCARAVPPGTRASIMGLQNIKGTGLDWVYRWVALDTVRTALDRLGSADPERRSQGLRELEAFEDHGLVDAALMRERLPSLLEATTDPETRTRLERLRDRAEETWTTRKTALATNRQTTRMDRFVAWMERGLDYLDSVRRRGMAERLVDDLVFQRISHARAVVELRKLNARQKGGWLAEALRRT